MKRSTKCVVQTINLSNPATCRKPKVPKLVSAGSSSDPNRASDSWTPRPVEVKVCSWKDAQRKCPRPKFAAQKELPPLPLTTGAKLYRVTSFFVKGAIVAGLICWTCSEGLWSDSSKTEDLYYRMTSVIFPDRPARLPHLEGIKYSVYETYNHVVVKGMDIIVSVPRWVHRKLRDLVYPCEATKETDRKRKSSDENSMGT
ncbi:PREDICTED: uncharacterized protein LOC105455300 [Wasmannia auropunctata]|uniref:uncharacterized protein LOC105455300 n=1 Tax=Wasmannia auropunctata TaxID=64793 RepID=UPI0005F091D0|nr:PREDICTED: uncharacterized protein LOC105455300 [Wasmannia auropunctata]